MRKNNLIYIKHINNKQKSNKQLAHHARLTDLDDREGMTMYKTLINLMDDLEHKMSRKEYYDALDDICHSEHDILKLLCDGVTMTMQGKRGTDTYKKLVTDAVNGMKNINSYCAKCDYDAIFYFDESDETIFRCASKFEDSLRAYTLEELKKRA